MITVTCENGFKSVIENGDIVKSLSAQSSSNTRTVKDTAGNAYQVPVGRKFVIHSIMFLPSGNGLPQLRLWSSGSTDSASGTQILQDMEYKLTDDSSAVYLPFYCEVVAGQYINSQASNSGEKIQVIVNGVETSA